MSLPGTESVMALSTTVPALGEDCVHFLATTSAPPRCRRGSRDFDCLRDEIPGSFRITIIGDPYLGPALGRGEFPEAGIQEFVSKDAWHAIGLENVLDVRYRRQDSSSVDANHLLGSVAPTPPNREYVTDEAR